MVEPPVGHFSMTSRDVMPTSKAVSIPVDNSQQKNNTSQKQVGRNSQQAAAAAKGKHGVT